MQKTILLILILLNTSVVFSQDVINNQLTTTHKEVVGTKISLIPPDGFTSASNFSGFQQIQSGSSIMVLDIPGPFSEVSKGFTEEGLLSQGMISKEIKRLTLNNLPALFITAEQNAHGRVYTKYVLAFGTEKESILINGSFPKSNKNLSDTIQESLLSTTYDFDKEINPFDIVDFDINTEGTDMIFAKSVSNSLVFSRDGKFPSTYEDNALFLVTKAFSEVTVEDKKLFSLNRIKKLPLQIKKIKTTKSIEIDGLPGYEIVADAKNKKTGDKEHAFQVILFSDSLYYLLFGSSKLDTDIALFRKIAKTFKRKLTTSN